MPRLSVELSVDLAASGRLFAEARIPSSATQSGEYQAPFVSQYSYRKSTLLRQLHGLNLTANPVHLFVWNRDKMASSW